MTTLRWKSWMLGVILATAAGCALIPRPESCSPGASCMPLIEWDGAVYYQVGSRGAVIAASDTSPVGHLTAHVPPEAADGVVLALDGVDPASAVVMRADAGTEVAQGVTVGYLIFVREAAFPETLCPYFADDPPGDPAPPGPPDTCH